MSHFKTFMLGVGVSYAVYYLTRKRPDGTSIMDDLLADPEAVMLKAKDYAVAEAVHTVKTHLT